MSDMQYAESNRATRISSNRMGPKNWSVLKGRAPLRRATRSCTNAWVKRPKMMITCLLCARNRTQSALGHRATSEIHNTCLTA